MKKKWIALSLTLLLLLTCLPLTAAAASVPFSDVPQEDPAYPAVCYVYENGIMNGVGGDRFDLSAGFTRAMFVTVLGRMEGIDPADYSGTSFTDVSPKDASLSWAAPYIQWASENSIVNGVGNGKFDPNAIITKEQYCTIIQRCFIAMEGQLSATTPPFVYLTDGGDIHDYAKESVYALVGYGLIDPCADGAILPQHPMSRGEIAQTFARVHAYRTTGTVPQSLLTENTPDWLLFGAVTRQVGEFQELTGWEPTYTEFDYWFSITLPGYEAVGFHNGYENTDFLRSIDVACTGVSTARGISVGSTRAEVRAAYPTNLNAGELAPYTGDYLWYDASGEVFGWKILFWFENDRVSRILSFDFFD